MFYGIKNNKIISIIPFQYMSQNIPGPGCNMNDFEEKLLGCKCQNCDDDCKCTATFGKPYMNYKIQTDFIGPSVKPVFECNHKQKFLLKFSPKFAIQDLSCL
jgi:hypothetical protein